MKESKMKTICYNGDMVPSLLFVLLLRITAEALSGGLIKEVSAKTPRFQLKTH
jgi:hypothetical protein